ncbi:MAG: L,D-transpeptidase family protein [Gammaproteobacteria bacterium]|nr:L,D-transpeptidase family protein [Gammaproteobacteria bacterium]
MRDVLSVIKKVLLVAVVSAFFYAPLRADTFVVGEHQTVIGNLYGIKSRAEYSLVDVARHFDLGYNEITAANRQLNVWLPGDDNVVLIPARFILPRTPHSGIVLNLAEMRLYYYRALTQHGKREIVTYPVGIGRESWETPTLTTAVTEKKAQPSWFVPESIRIEYLAKGKQLPAVVKPGPDNPLGEYALRLGDTGYLIHGTNRPGGIGMRVSHGCIRLYPEDIESLFAQVALGTQVRIVDEPAKAGFLDGQLYLEAHAPYDGSRTQDQVIASATEVIAQTALGRSVAVNWDRVREVMREANGIPTAIGVTRPLDRQSSWMLIAGSFDAESKARSLAARIGEARLESRTWTVANRYQVEVGPFADVHQADYARKLIRQRTGILALKIPPG